MIVTVGSGAFARPLERGDLTQLEFLDACAGELACDGAVLDVEHFPRSDDDYLAQIKKLCADRGLRIAALADAAFFGAEEERMRQTLHYAVALGAPLLAGSLARETDCAWSDQVERLNAATSFAKAVNVTLALRNAPGTFAATVHDCKRVAKETDSAWLRFGIEPQAFDAASDPAAIASNVVLLWSAIGEEDERSRNALLETFAAFRGALVLNEPSGEAGVLDMKQAVRAWRTALAQRVLDRT